MLQDTATSHSTSQGASIGVGSNNTSLGYNQSYSYSESAWVTNQTSIVATDSLTAKVTGNLDNTGAAVTTLRRRESV